MKTDTIFYEIFKEFPQIFFELIGKPETNTNRYQFQSPEVKQLNFRLDGIFLPSLDYPTEPIYFVEVQFYKDEDFYDRFFASIFLYFSQAKPINSDWYAVVIYDKRSKEASPHPRYRSLIDSHLRIFYLNELETETINGSLGLGIVKLIVETQSNAADYALTLIEKAQAELTDTNLQTKVLGFIETIVVYKFPNLSREEVEKMLNLDFIKHTKVYQEVKEEGKIEGKLETIPKLVEKGMSIQEIAEILDLDIEVVKKSLK
ncbi:MAG: Rpn family recombination-promoting nuclease/putative transposase [Kamptonema sp. SIO1D9]|nr:Rpn family recombination-promoting nuclease/putative transposase [Kamptonema sp. SIO1D9]